MDQGITLTVPELLTATYVVPTSTPPRDPVAAALDALPRHVSGNLAELARSMMDGPVLDVQVVPAGEVPAPPTHLLRLFGAEDIDLTRIESAGHVIVVSSTYPPGWPPAHEWAARATALALAEAQAAGPIIDVFTPRVLDPAGAGESLPDEHGRFRLADWLMVPYSPEDLGFWFTTKGLGRFGLPELQAHGVPPQFLGPWARVMTGVANRLLREWLDGLGGPVGQRPSFLTVPSMVTVAAPDVSAAYGETTDRESSVTVRLLFDPATDEGSDSFLTVQPPDDYRASAGEFFAEVCHVLFDQMDRDIRHVRSGDAAMRKAMETATASLPKARARFIGGELPPGSQLIVKHGLQGANGNEFVWVFVTSWTDPATLLGTYANDADSDPAVRVGRPAAVPATSVVDWAIWVDGQGVVEGGWTQQVLTRDH